MLTNRYYSIIIIDQQDLLLDSKYTFCYEVDKYMNTGREVTKKENVITYKK